MPRISTHWIQRRSLCQFDFLTTSTFWCWSSRCRQMMMMTTASWQVGGRGWRCCQTTTEGGPSMDSKYLAVFNNSWTIKKVTTVFNFWTEGVYEPQIDLYICRCVFSFLFLLFMYWSSKRYLQSVCCEYGIVISMEGYLWGVYTAWIPYSHCISTSSGTCNCQLAHAMMILERMTCKYMKLGARINMRRIFCSHIALPMWTLVAIFLAL